LAVQKPMISQPGELKHSYIEWYEFSKRIDTKLHIVPLSEFVCNIRVFEWSGETLVQVDEEK
jgi:hypothetical protein